MSQEAAVNMRSGRALVPSNLFEDDQIDVCPLDDFAKPVPEAQKLNPATLVSGKRKLLRAGKDDTVS